MPKPPWREKWKCICKNRRFQESGDLFSRESRTVMGALPRVAKHQAIQLICHSPRIQEVVRIVERVAQVDIPVLITGESGSGKEVVARLIHQESSRGSGPFWKINCAAIPHELLESELFGFERGSFTQAFRSKPGTFELATKAPSTWTKLVECPYACNPNCCRYCRINSFHAWGLARKFPWIRAFFPPAISLWTCW